MKKILAIALAAALCFPAVAAKKEKKNVAAAVERQWSAQKAQEWWAAQEWPVGCTYTPTYAVNQYECWQADSFSPEIIEKEFELCKGLGFNLVRMYLHEDLWFADADGFKQRIGKVLDIAAGKGLKLTFTFFTNGGSSAEQPGPQPEPSGVHGGGHWVQSPRDGIFFDESRWGELKDYLQDILKTFGKDKRILFWCIYNEPENLRSRTRYRNALPLMRKLYEWAWEVRPDQPLSSSVWYGRGANGDYRRMWDIFSFVCLNSDIINFHCYQPVYELEPFVKELAVFHRPMICEEYMARTQGSTFDRCLTFMKQEKIGAISWGLAEGKCKWRYPRGHKEGDPEPEIWFHSLYDENYKPFSEIELEMLKRITAEKEKAGQKPVYPIDGWGVQAPAPEKVKQWTAEQARNWWDGQEWPVGCMMIPAGTRNQYDLWQSITWDESQLQREFALCSKLGFNTVRLYLHEDIWFADAEGFKQRIGKVLDIAAENGIRITFTFCTNGGSSKPVFGKKQQPGDGWVQSPKDPIFFDESRWPEFKEYMQDILRTFKDDDRILYWCLYNEPENLRSYQRKRDVMKFMAQMYEWAWEIRPSQPLASSVWYPLNDKGNPRVRYDVDAFALEYSDIIVFHSYRPPVALHAMIKSLHRFQRPMICEEYMARNRGSYFDAYLPIFKREKIGAINWGLLSKTAPGEKPYSIWQHDIFYNDGRTPYCEAEIKYLKEFLADKSDAGKDPQYPIKPE